MAQGLALAAVLIAVLVVLGSLVYRSLEPTPAVSEVDNRPGIPASTSTTLSDTATSTTDGKPSGSTTTTVPGSLIRPKSVSSSSALEPTSTNNYRATNLLDDNLATAWNEGAEGPGLGEWVLFKFVEPTKMVRIEIANGYQKDRERFEGNPRVRRLRLDYSNGGSQMVELLDTMDPQYISTLTEEADWLRLTIVSVYPGYTWADAALSEVHLYEMAAE